MLSTAPISRSAFSGPEDHGVSGFGVSDVGFRFGAVGACVAFGAPGHGRPDMCVRFNPTFGVSA